MPASLCSRPFKSPPPGLPLHPSPQLLRPLLPSPQPTSPPPPTRRAQEEQFLKRYIQYCRHHCYARLSEDAQQTLISEYVRMRDVAKQVGRARAEGRGRWPGVGRR
jgi:hypothetical protein